jgi:hypothetical protein
MTLNQYLGDSVAHEVPLRWQRVPFEPGEDWTLIFTAKLDSGDADEDAVIQKASGIGIAVSGSTATVTTVPVDTTSLTARDLEWDIQAQHVVTGAVRTVAAGILRLARDATRLTETSIEIFTTEPGAPLGVARVLAAIQAMDASQKTSLLAALGIPTYASDTAANDALTIGDVYRDSSDSNKLKSATR